MYDKYLPVNSDMDDETQLFFVCNAYYLNTIFIMKMLQDINNWWKINNEEIYYDLNYSHSDIRYAGEFEEKSIKYSEYISYALNGRITYEKYNYDDLIIKVNTYHQEYLKNRMVIDSDKYINYHN